jgi:SOS-response transcriptional repressor LexA
MTPEDRLKMWVDEGGRGTQTKLAKHLNTTTVAVNKWINDPAYKIQTEHMVAIEDFFGKPRGSLLDDNLKSVMNVPVIGETSCGAAIGSSFQDVGRTCYYRGDMFHNDLYCVIASGDSMAPEIEDGDEIVCDPRVKPAHGDLVHYLIHGESAVKVYVVDNDAHIVQFVPYNSSETFKTRTIRLDDEEAGELKIVKVVAVNKLKFNNKSARLKLIGRA